MAERQIRRNGRGQIISYEIFGALDSNIESDSYGKSRFTNAGENGTKVSKFVEDSYNNIIDTTLSDELRRPLRDTNLNVELGEVALNFVPVIKSSTSSGGTSSSTSSGGTSSSTSSGGSPSGTGTVPARRN
ncbi:hypothetical protein N9W01_00075 [bacterium]|nr:hypothetical protein [bacterium]